MVNTFNPVFFRTYSRFVNGHRESWEAMRDRVVSGLVDVGKLTPKETELVHWGLTEKVSFPSGRWLWVGGTDWIKQPENYSGAFNCTSTNIVDWRSFGLVMDLAMMGSGTGAVLEEKYIDELPKIRNRLNIEVTGEFGEVPKKERRKNTLVFFSQFAPFVDIIVGDSRQGWVKAYQTLLELSSDPEVPQELTVTVDLSHVRKSGERLNGFGGIANPIKLPELFPRVAKILNKAQGRKLTAEECCLLIDEAAKTIVAGNIRRSAGIRQFDSKSPLLKQNLWQPDAEGNWRIDPDRDALRMANHTRVYHHKPSLEECVEAVRSQFYSGEGAIQYAPEAIARSNADLLHTPKLKREFLDLYQKHLIDAEEFLLLLQSKTGKTDYDEIDHRIARYALNPCAEIQGSNFHCNLAEIHLNQIDPSDRATLKKAFQVGAINVAALLHMKFEEPRYQYSRELDPIVGVSFTGFFDFCVRAFGVDWLRWWEAGRPEIWGDYVQLNGGGDIPQSVYFRISEQSYLEKWKKIVHQTVWEYCDRHNLKRPNRCTTLQPSGCLTKDALRIFDQGLMYADEHMIGGEGEVNLEELNLSVRQGVSVFSGIANPEIDLVQVTLKNGRQITMTENHRLSVEGKWVQAIDLIEGMKIDFSLGEYRKGDNPILKSVELTDMISAKGRRPKGCKLPSRMSSELAYLIGAIFGNGCFSKHKYRIRISHRNLEVLSRLSDIGLQLFGLKGVLHQDGDNCYELCFANKQLYLFFIENNLEKNSKSKDIDRIPLLIRQSSREAILAFIAGLIDTDGCIRKEGSLSIDSASESFVRSMQQIAEAVGLSFSFYVNIKGTNKQEKKQMYGLSLSRMVSQRESLQFLNSFSVKASSRPIQCASRQFSFHPYQIAKIEKGVVDYSFDYAIDGENDDDSWYWQGALKSHNTKSLLTGASPSWQPPKAARFIRRVTFGKNDPVALACIDYGYKVIPSQSDKDENGKLLNDPFDPRCTEWLVEIPCESSWANLEGVEEIDISKFSALAQFDFYMQCQKHYITHNGSSTIELREDEIEPLGKRIYDAIAQDEGYISTALLARFDDHQTYPRLPFEPIDKPTYNRLIAEVKQRRITGDFHAALAKYDVEGFSEGPVGCDSDKCLFPEQ